MTTSRRIVIKQVLVFTNLSTSSLRLLTELGLRGIQLFSMYLNYHSQRGMQRRLMYRYPSLQGLAMVTKLSAKNSDLDP